MTLKITPLVRLAPLHTFGIDTKAAQLVEIAVLSALPTSLQDPYYLLGEGSNSVFLEDYEGCILKVNLKGIEIKETADNYEVKVAAGENWHSLVELLLSKGIYGAENLALIPGTVGAAPIQNIGAYGRELAEFCACVRAHHLSTGERLQFSNSECQFGYRDSIFKRPEMSPIMITEVILHFPKNIAVQTDYGELKALGSLATPMQVFNKVVETRRLKLPDPAVFGNAGSFFKNPIIASSHYESLKQAWPNIPGFVINEHEVKVPAAWLIDRLGFKGKVIGGVACHANQPLVLLNEGTATGQELLELARAIRSSVETHFSITLENEVRLIGAQGLVAL